ncbi:ATP-binding protein [Edaphobacter sp. HDX4]|uniref:ATP-binding protein n=1 Tax=Edaphobacter sp. HDX4 TaxID=2794064 RepID=UPI002FE54160
MGENRAHVIQDGTGIKPEHLEKIFEPFFTTKGDLETGIGLWVARQLIERRGGQFPSLATPRQSVVHNGHDFYRQLPLGLLSHCASSGGRATC